MRSRPILTTFLALALSLAVAPRVAAQRTSPAAPALRVRPAVQTRVEQALLAIDTSAPPAFWASLGSEGLAALAVILDDGARPAGLRRRAVVALGHYDVAAAHALLDALARSRTEDEIVSLRALDVLATLRGASALTAIERGLADPRALVREGAAQTLGRLVTEGAIDPAIALRVLGPARARETEAFVRLALDRAVEARPESAPR
jgi:HEAT repeat protein